MQVEMQIWWVHTEMEIHGNRKGWRDAGREGTCVLGNAQICGKSQAIYEMHERVEHKRLTSAEIDEGVAWPLGAAEDERLYWRHSAYKNGAVLPKTHKAHIAA